MQIFFIYFSIFVCALIGSDLVIRRLRDSLEKRRFVNYRLSLIEENADRRQVYDRMLKERGYGGDSGDNLIARLMLYFAQSGVRFDGMRTPLHVVSVFLAIFLLLFMMGYGGLVGLAVAVIATVLTAVLFVWFSRQRRIRRFVDQLPEALEVIVRSLSAGHPLPTSIALVAREMPDPLGSEFGLMSDEMTYGTDVDVAVRNMERRIGASELSLLSISLSVQRGVGGNLAEILKNLADMIRKRTMMRAKIKAISAEGRMTSWFMLCFPFFLYGMIKLIRQDYFDPLWDSGYGSTFLTAAGVLMVIGMLILRKLVNFDY
jgi:tight adherence protein B